MSPQRYKELENAFWKESVGSPRWRMLELQMDIQSCKENLAFYKQCLERDCASEETKRLMEETVKAEEKLLKKLLDKIHTL